MMRAWRIVVCLSTGVWLGACGGSSAEHQDAATGYLGIVCAYEVRCGQMPDQQTCEAHRGSEQFLVDVQAALDSGRALLPSKCVALLAQTPCTMDSWSALVRDRDCQHVVTGTLGAGETCYSYAECVSGRCEQVYTDGQVCPAGVCTTPVSGPTLGQTCRSDADCDRIDEFCDSVSSPLERTCRGRLAIGDPCSDSQCAIGTFCSDDGVCAAYAKDGEPCERSSGCASRLSYCDWTTRTCLPRLELGQACTDDEACPPYGTCSGGVCKEWPRVGESCGYDDGGFGTQMCLAGRCTAGVCVAVPVPTPCRDASGGSVDTDGGA